MRPGSNGAFFALLVPISLVAISLVSISFMALMLAGPLDAGEIYKWVDEEGNIIYSDTPRPGAEEVHVGPLQTYRAPPAPPITPSQAQPEPPDYDAFRVLNPKDEETFRDNAGRIQITLLLSPGLRRGHTISIFMDGKELDGSGRSTSLTLTNVDRGSHTVHATVKDGEGKQVAKTEPITFHLHRASRLIN